jgi:hypothetical protein
MEISIYLAEEKARLKNRVKTLIKHHKEDTINYNRLEELWRLCGRPKFRYFFVQPTYVQNVKRTKLRRAYVRKYINVNKTSPGGPVLGDPLAKHTFNKVGSHTFATRSDTILKHNWVFKQNYTIHGPAFTR